MAATMLNKFAFAVSVLATSAFALTPILGPSECGSGVVCCQAMVAPQTTVSPLSDIAIFPPIGLVGVSCAPLVIPLDIENVVVPCTGIAACCPPNLLQTAPSSTIIKGAKVTPGCSIVDIAKN